MIWEPLEKINISAMVELDAEGAVALADQSADKTPSHRERDQPPPMGHHRGRNRNPDSHRLRQHPNGRSSV
jgi:hypothetical protein